jgi:hypothetical protein
MVFRLSMIDLRVVVPLERALARMIRTRLSN